MGGLSQDHLLDRIKNLEYELSSYKSYIAQSLPENTDLSDSDDNSNSRNTKRKTVKPKKTENQEEPEKEFHQSKQLLELIEDLTEKNRGLESSERKALIKFEKEYSKKMKILDQTDKLKTNLENQLALIMIENETLLKENQWRKDFNVSNAKEIETIVKDNKILKMKVKDLENGNANWRLKYENQELIKKNIDSNPKFRQTYVEVMSQRKTEDKYMGRLSHVQNITANSRSTARQVIKSNLLGNKTDSKIHNIKEDENEDSEEDNLADELGGLEGFNETDFGDLEQREGSGEEGNDNGVYRASEFDNERYTILDKERASNINIGLAAKNFKKTALESINEDEYYDPIKDKVRELKQTQQLNKEKVIQQLEAQKEEFDEAEGNLEEKKDEIDENLFEEIAKTKNPTKNIRETVANITKPNLVTAETQTIAKTEVVQIENTKAMIIYEEPEEELKITEEGETQETNETVESKTAERENTNINYIQDASEEIMTGETGRIMLKVQNEEGEIMLIDKGKNRIIETVTTEVQTEVEYKLEVSEKPEQVSTKPVAAIDNESDGIGDSSEGEEVERAEEEEDALFSKLDQADSRQKDLEVINEEEEEASTFKTRPQPSTKEETKHEENVKIKEETTNRIKTILEKQVRVSQFNGRGQSTLRDNTIIDKISKIKNFDFLALRSKDNKYYKRVTRILERYGELPRNKGDGMECFTEYIYKIDTTFKKQKRKILVTPDAFYQLSKNFSVVYRVPLENIKALTLIKKSASLLAIHCPGTFDHLIEVVRRTELVMFLMHMFDVKKIKKPKIHYADGLKTKCHKKNKPDENKILKFDPSAKQDVSSSNVALLKNLSSINFINSYKYGYLLKKANSYFKKWSEKFCVITNVGLLYYNNPDNKPRNLFPIIDAKISPVKKKTYK